MSEPKMSAVDRLQPHVKVAIDLAPHGPDALGLRVVRVREAAAAAEEHAAAAVADAEKRWMLNRARCECSLDDACRFARERDEALARIATLEREIERLAAVVKEADCG